MNALLFVYVTGDFNVNLLHIADSSMSHFGTELLQYCDESGLIILDYCFTWSFSNYIFISAAHDHCV